MTDDDLATIEAALAHPSIDELAAVSAIEALSALRRRDWAVHVLDAWALENLFRTPPVAAPYRADGGIGALVFTIEAHGVALFRSYPSADAARDAAALAVYPTLPEAVRAELGECP